jgi:hypothetical protein
MILKLGRLWDQCLIAVSVSLSLSFSTFTNADGRNILQCIKVDMIVTMTTLCYVNDYVSKHDRHAKNKVICALLGILRGNWDKKISFRLHHTASCYGNRGCSYLDIMESISSFRLHTMRNWALQMCQLSQMEQWFHFQVTLTTWAPGLLSQGSLIWVFAGTSRLLFYSHMSQWLLLSLGTNHWGTCTDDQAAHDCHIILFIS